MDSLFPSFPKKRKPLPAAYAALYLSHYRNSREGRTAATSMAGRLERWMHRRVSEDLRAVAHPGPTLEIGAGTLNHLPWEPQARPYDIVEPFRELYESQPARAAIRNSYADISEIPADQVYARIISIATFEHIEDLPGLTARATLLLQPDGCARIAIPSEGGLLWKLAWKMTTGLEFRARYGLDYSVLMAYEHVNTATEILQVCRYFFGRVGVRTLGPGLHGSFYHFLECHRPRYERARDYLLSPLSARP